MTHHELVQRVVDSNSTTVVARAFRRALAIPHPQPKPKAKRRRRRGRWKGKRECFENRETPMDWTDA